MPPLVLERLDLGQTPGNRKGNPLRDGGGALNRNAGKIEAAVNSLSGLTLVAGPVAKLAPGANPTASLTGAAPNLTLNLGLPEGAAGAGAPNSADILAIPEMARLERSLTAAGVPDEPSLILDFIRGAHFASKSAIAASITTIIAALGGVSNFSRASTATYWDSDGLLKTAANNVPRLEYDPVTRLSRGLLYERVGRTNSNTYSEQLNHASYGQQGCSVVADALTDPYGTTTMDKIVEDTGVNTFHYLTRSVGQDSNNLAERCLSQFVVAAGRTRGRIFFCDWETKARQIYADFDLTAGTIGAAGAAGGATAGSTGIENLGGGLYRIYVTGTLGGGTLAEPRLYLADAAGNRQYTGDGVSGMGSWGWQWEAGSSPSSYITTVASTVTRAADALTIDKASWLGAAAGGVMTVVLETDTIGITPGSTFVAYVNSASGTDYVSLREGSGIGGWDLYTSAGGTGIINTPGYPATIGTVMRFVIGLDAASWAFSANNALSHSGGATTLPTGLDRLVFGNFMGHIRRIIVWPQRLSNTKIQALSNQAAWS